MSDTVSAGACLIAAQQNAAPPWWIFLLLGAISVMLVSMGVYGVTTGRAIVPHKLRLVLRLLGIEEVSGRAAIVIGSGQCAVGGLLLLAAVTGPFWAGVWADSGPSAERGLPDSIATSGGPSPADRVEPAARPGDSTPSVPLAPAAVPTEPPAEPPALRAGLEQGQAFSDRAPDGGVLVGLRCAKGSNWGGALQAVQPIYQVGTGYALGLRHGRAGGDECQLLAKPGYAVGGVNARAGLVLNAVQLVFYRVAGQQLDPGDRYESAWVGSDGGGLFQLDARGVPLTGLSGTWQDDLVSLTLAPGAALSEPLPVPTADPPDLDSELRAGVLLGLAQGTAFSESAPAGGVLVGVRAFCDESPQTLRSLQPIYLAGERYVEGQRLGRGGQTPWLTVARPGYAVLGVAFNVFGDTAGMRLRYGKLSPGGPSSEDAYESPWLGYEFDDAGQEASADARFAVGLTGYFDETILGLGLVLVGPRAVQLAATAELPPEYRKAAYARPRLRAGAAAGTAFDDAAPAGGLLVGLRCAKGTNWGGAIQAVQPIYQVGPGYAVGGRHGKLGGDEQTLVAKPGYAVGAVQARAGLALNAVQLVFYRIAGQRLDPADRYASPWVGCEGGSPYQLDPQGDPIIGVFGHWADDLVSVGVEPTQSLPAAIPPPETSPPNPGPETPSGE